jgi:hypothetical protein
MIIKQSFNVLTYHFCVKHSFFVCHFQAGNFLASLFELNIEINEHIIELTSCLNFTHASQLYLQCVCEY